ncbi:hypothetical protein K439DRAFT_1624849 [Ramaria rubella]|nr:hypothetical protein K439DRAFT_1624849 [Ramaria rubella]
MLAEWTLGSWDRRQGSVIDTGLAASMSGAWCQHWARGIDSGGLSSTPDSHSRWGGVGSTAGAWGQRRWGCGVATRPVASMAGACGVDAKWGRQRACGVDAKWG